MQESRKTVVYIEDEAEMIHLVTLILEREGFDVVGAVGGRNGLEAVREIRPDLVLLDLMMPDMDGWEVYSRLKSDEMLKSIPVIIITARSQRLDKTLALRVAKVNGYITKPFHAKELTGSVIDVFKPNAEGGSNGGSEGQGVGAGMC